MMVGDHSLIHFVALSDEDVNERVVKIRARGVKRHERYVKISQRDISKNWISALWKCANFSDGSWESGTLTDVTQNLRFCV